MPSKNTVKSYKIDTYYHVYNRGVNRRNIFLDNEDYRVFLNLLKRYLDESPTIDKKGRQYRWLKNDVRLEVFCLMPNHFHLLLFQLKNDGITTLLRSVCTTYTTYFNKKYSRVGSLFQGIYKASEINSDSYLEHITRYIHLNPTEYLDWPFSSLNSYIQKNSRPWLYTKNITNMYSSAEEYLSFINDHKDYLDSLEVLETELANVSKVEPWKHAWLEELRDE